MKITSIRFGRTVSKNYQSQRIEYEATLTKGESHEEALAALRTIVDRAAQAWDPDTLEQPSKAEQFEELASPWGEGQ